MGEKIFVLCAQSLPLPNIKLEKDQKLGRSLKKKKVLGKHLLKFGVLSGRLLFHFCQPFLFNPHLLIPLLPRSKKGSHIYIYINLVGIGTTSIVLLDLSCDFLTWAWIVISWTWIVICSHELDLWFSYMSRSIAFILASASRRSSFSLIVSSC